MSEKAVNADEEEGPADGAGSRALREGVDYYLEGNLFVFTEGFLLRRGYCCDSGCRHCPYERRAEHDGY